MPFLNDDKSIFLFGLTAGFSVAAVMQFVQYLYNHGNSGTAIANGSGRPRRSIAAQGGPLAKIEEEFQVTSERLHRIARQMVSEMRRGLAADGQTLKMIPSHVTKRPNGSESGTFLALDLGGSNFRVCEVTLLGGSSPRAGQQLVRVRQKKFTVSDELKKGNGVKLFDFFADCVKLFVEEIASEDAKSSSSTTTTADAVVSEFDSSAAAALEYHSNSNQKHDASPNKNNSKNSHKAKNVQQVDKKLGFTFSFPVHQISINKGNLMQWTKGFVASVVEGQDVVQLLQEAFNRKKLSIKVTALVNDTVGTLVAHAYTDPQTYAGVILGTGTNAAYVEEMTNIPKWKGPHVPTGEMIINTEWGAFDEEQAVLPVTEYDRTVDKASEHQGQQIYEKMISGLYLGEIVRVILMDLVFTGFLFNGVYPPSKELAQRHSFDTAYMSRIERDHTIELSDTKMVLEDILKVPNTSIEDRHAVKRVCEIVGTRAARLSAAGVAALVTKMNRLDGCTVAIDGSLFEHYPHFGNRMRDGLREILGITAENILLAQARDGSGQGAAIIAALAKK